MRATLTIWRTVSLLAAFSRASTARMYAAYDIRASNASSACASNKKPYNQHKTLDIVKRQSSILVLIKTTVNYDYIKYLTKSIMTSYLIRLHHLHIVHRCGLLLHVITYNSKHWQQTKGIIMETAQDILSCLSFTICFATRKISF